MDSFEVGGPTITHGQYFSESLLPDTKQRMTSVYKTYREKDLLKAANIYSQFDKKGNLYENRLYVKTSIN